MSCTDDNIERIGKARYEEIRPQMEAEHWGKIVVVDAHSGDYEIGGDACSTIDRLLERRPDAMPWAERAGYPAVYYMHWRPHQLLPYPPSGDFGCDSIPAISEGDPATPCADDEIERLGKARYAEIRPQMEAEHWGKIVVVDVHSGDYEIGDDDWSAIDRLLERRPDAMPWAERVGYPAIYYTTWRPQLLPYPPNGDFDLSSDSRD